MFPARQSPFRSFTREKKWHFCFWSTRCQTLVVLSRARRFRGGRAYIWEGRTAALTSSGSAPSAPRAAAAPRTRCSDKQCTFLFRLPAVVMTPRAHGTGAGENSARRLACRTPCASARRIAGSLHITCARAGGQERARGTEREGERARGTEREVGDDRRVSKGRRSNARIGGRSHRRRMTTTARSVPRCPSTLDRCLLLRRLLLLLHRSVRAARTRAGGDVRLAAELVWSG